MAPQPIPSPQIISLIPASPSPSPLPHNPQGEGALAHSTGDRANGSDNSNDSHASAAKTASVPEVIIQEVNRSDRKGVSAQSKGANHSSTSTPVLSLRDDAIAQFMAAKNLAPKSQKAYRLDIARFTQWCDRPGSPYVQQPWRDVSVRQLRLFKTCLQQEQSLSNGTVRRTLSTLKQFFAWMQANDLIERNPTLTLELPDAPSPVAKDLSEAEVRWLYGAASFSPQPERNTAIVSLLLHGLRAEEVCNLNVGDFDGMRVHIRQAKADSIGSVPLRQVAQAHVQQYLEWRQGQAEGERLAGMPLSPESPLFVSYSARNRYQRLGYDGLYYLLTKTLTPIAQQFAQEEGKVMSPIHPHRGRHTFATNLVLDGIRYKTMDSRLAMKLTRHRSANSFDRYVKRADELLAEAAFFETESLKQGDDE